MLRDEGEISNKHNFVFNISVSSAAGQTAVGSLAQNNVFLTGVYERGEGGEQPEVANTNIPDKHNRVRYNRL